jgi:cation:H+ antiporter
MLIDILILLGALFLLIRSGSWVLQPLSCIARFLRWSEFLVAFVMVAFISSLPELFIGISSALHGVPEVSFGNIIGANVINLTLAVGIAVFLMGGVQIEREIVKKDALYTAGVAILPLILILDGKLSRADGAVLLFMFVLYALWLFSKKERFSRVYNNNHNKLGFKGFFKNIFLFLAGIVLLLVSAELIIGRVVSLAKTLNIASVYIGIFLIGLGTALPETFFAIKAALKGKKEMILGNLMGAVIITSLLVLGVVALISPIEIADFSPYLIARLFLFIAAISFFIFIRTGESVSKKEALFLVAVYASFVIAQILGY